MIKNSGSTGITAALRWRPSTLAILLAMCGSSGLIAGLVAQDPRLAIFAAPFLGAVSTAAWAARGRGRLATEVVITAEPELSRIFERESVTLRCAAHAIDGMAVLSVTPVAAAGLTLTQLRADGSFDASATRWGNYPIAIEVHASAPGGLLDATVRETPARIHAYPLAPPNQTPLPPTKLPDRIGTHLTKRYGPGVEYADTRGYLPGDPLHAINWKVSARTGRMHVTERFTDRAADIVAIIDTYPHAPGPASNGLERAVRGAAQITQSALQRGDRAGVIALGTRARWLGAELGRKQFYRILDAVLAAGDDHHLIRGTLAPVDAVPRGAVIIGFSPLLETQFSLAMIELRRRGHTVVLVDVLGSEPPFDDELDDISARMWRIERRSQARDLGTVGIDILEWEWTDESGAGLEHAFRLISRRPVRPRRRV
ncbi:DUF58 domain-containing protein [Hoyosella sp. YIM 151337]|uniref:DUF58 domain-containing protein n=1 Tax=Hoyosella sp. YIM 151337 TaxID=2992742 RepID=UPI0022355D8B|nr:DUF58 domain-containing protein [Hoyosella sp. YIM 151337]MCW4354918.1 DUF58 domain-containing protein [Hoyosella sp. YIM 151337]